jgi:hypothetical protein
MATLYLLIYFLELSLFSTCASTQSFNCSSLIFAFFIILGAFLFTKESTLFTTSFLPVASSTFFSIISASLGSYLLIPFSIHFSASSRRAEFLSRPNLEPNLCNTQPAKAATTVPTTLDTIVVSSIIKPPMPI